MNDDDDKIVHVTFNPSKQTESDKIDFSMEKFIERQVEEMLKFTDSERKSYVEDLLALGYDEFTAFKLARDLCKKPVKKSPH